MIDGNLKPLVNFTADERRVICERHTGWEKASISTLAAVFDAHPNTIAAILREGK